MHCSVGSIVNLNNIRIASLLGADMMLVANGGIRSAVDKLELNWVYLLYQHYKDRLTSFIINKV